MLGLLELLQGPKGKQLIQGIAGQSGQSVNQTESVLSMALPLLMGAMKKNAASPEGAKGLLNALSNKSHDGSILDNLDGLFSGGVDQSVMDDGAGILKHVFGSKESHVENAIGSKSGLNSGTIATILKVAAPLLMGYLGKQTRQNHISDANGIEGLLGGLMGGGKTAQKEQSLIETFLDSDGDGSVLDDIASIALGGKKSGGIGGLLGGLFGK